MRIKLLFCLVLLMTVGNIVKSQPVKPTITDPSNNAVNVALQPNISIYLNTGLADSFLVEIDTISTFNSGYLRSYKSYYKVCANCTKLPLIKFSPNQTIYIRSRAWRAGLIGAWSNTTKFTTIFKALPIQNTAGAVEFAAVMPEFMYSFSATNVQYQVSDASDFSNILLAGQAFPHDSFEGNYYNTNLVRLRGLPQNKTMYMRSRYFLRKDTLAWGTTHNFILKYVPQILTSSGSVSTLAYSPSINHAIYVYNNYTDTSVFYEYQRSSSATFSPQNTTLTTEYVPIIPLKSGANYIRYRVVHRSVTTGWSNALILNTNTALPAPILSGGFNATRTAQATVGENMSVLQWQADTSLNFNTARLLTWDSLYKPINATKYYAFTSDDFAKFRNCYIRYRTGNGTDWLAWSAPSKSMFWQIQGSTQNQNFYLFQQFDFFALNNVQGFFVQCDVDSAFKSSKMFSYSTSGSAVSFAVPEILLNNSPLYYRVCARSTSGLSTPRIYSIVTTIVPTIWSPGSGNSFDEAVPFSIAGKTGQADLEFEVATDVNFTKIDGRFITANGGNNGTLPVSKPGAYFFRVRYANSRSVGKWSSVVSFKITKVSQMAPPLLRSPSNGNASVNSKKAKFVWNHVPGANQYLISIFSASTSKLVYQNFTDSNWIYATQLPANEKLKWSVLAMGDKESRVYSETWTFNTDASVGLDDLLNSKPSKQSLIFYPMPASQTVWLAGISDDNSSCVELYTTDGKLLLSQSLQNVRENGFSISGCASGIYWVRCGNQSAKLFLQH